MRSPRVTEEQVERAYERLQANSVVRTIMQCARRLGVPYSAAVVLWDRSEDLAMEMAYERLQANERLERCQECGTKPEEIWDPVTHRPLTWGYWRHEVYSCRSCQDARRLGQQLSDRDRELGAYVRTVPRGLTEDYSD